MSSMPVPTASQRIAHILTVTRGNRSQAEAMIREAIDRDPQFLRQLVDPFLKGIIAHALSRAPMPAAAAAPVKSLSDDHMNALMRGLESHTVTEPSAKPPGQGHADAMRAIAEAHKQRRDK